MQIRVVSIPIAFAHCHATGLANVELLDYIRIAMNVLFVVAQMQRGHRKRTHAAANAIGLEMQAAYAHALVHPVLGYTQIVTPFAHLLRTPRYRMECDVLIVVSLAFAAGHTADVHAVAHIQQPRG